MAIRDDERRRRRLILGAGLVAASVVVILASWVLIPNGILLLVSGEGGIGILLTLLGAVCLVGGVLLLLVGLRQRRIARMDPHAPVSPDGKANPRYQEDQTPKAFPGEQLGWVGSGASGL